MPEGQHKHIAESRRRRVDRLDRRHAVHHAVIVYPGGIERLGQGEAAEVAAIGAAD